MRLKVLMALLCGFLLLPQANAFQHGHENELADFDTRALTSQMAPEKKQVVQKLKEQLDSSVELDAFTGAPQFISSRNGFLVEKASKGGISPEVLARFAAADRHRITKAFVQEHKDLFGHGAEALQTAKISRDYVSKHNGLKTTVWHQELDGLPVFDAYFVSHITKSDELVSVSSRFVADPAGSADRGVKNRQNILASPPVSVRRAISVAAKNLGDQVDAEKVEQRLSGVEGQKHLQKFKVATLPGDTYAGLVWLPVSEDELRLCWQVVLIGGEHREMFLLLVDAVTEEVVIRRGLTRYLSNATYNVFTGASPTPMAPGPSAPSTLQPPLVSRQLVTLSALNTNASPLGWITDGGNTTVGNNVEAQLDRDGNDQPDLPRPQGTSRVFNFPLDLAQEPTSYGDAATVQLFYWCNWMHDKLYELGFTEEVGNFQQTNFGRGGYGTDAIQADAQDRLNFVSPRNNASFSTPADGLPGRMQIYTFNGPDPDRDAALDAHIVLHEYTHGLSDRLVGGGMGMVAGTMQSRGMAEGWSDFFALALLSQPTNDVHGIYPFGSYVAYKASFSFEQNYYFGIRRYPYSTDLARNPLTFKDIDPGQFGYYPSSPRSTYPFIAADPAALHNQGEVWCVTLWEARANLIVKHGFSTGNHLILQLVTDGMKLCPPNPNFLQARDGILLADRINNAGANQAELWSAFAKRGMGFFASSPSSSTTQGVVESFSLPDDLSILPDAGLVASGMVGGPFLPNTRTYIFSNIGPGSVTWSTLGLSNWLTISTSGGTLLSLDSQSISVSINQAVAGSLGAGIYTNRVIFTNQTSGLAQSRVFTLLVGQPDHYTEIFEVNDFDLSYQSFTFTPDESNSGYSLCRSLITNFTSDPAGGSALVLGDDNFQKIDLSNDVLVYSSIADEVYVGSNGYITWGSGDTRYADPIASHFSLPRVSALFRDLIPQTNSVSWKQYTNRVAVTYTNVIEWGTSKTNNFQIELFFDGRIRLSYLQMGTLNGLVGLARGGGLPEAFIETDFNSFVECAPALVVTLPAGAFEGDGTLASAGQVSVASSLLVNRTIELYWSDNTELTLPTQIVLPAGQTSVFFDISVIDDLNVDGSRPVVITAVATGYQNGRATMQVHDNEVATLLLAVPGPVNEADGTIQCTVTTDFAPTDDVRVALATDAPGKLLIPASVTIPAGQNFGIFSAVVVDNQQIEQNYVVNLSAVVVGWQGATLPITIVDDEDFSLRLELPRRVSEGNGTLGGAGSLHLSGQLSEDLVIQLTSAFPSQVSVPQFLLIPAGQTFATFDITIGDDLVLDGEQLVQVEAVADGFDVGLRTVSIADNETPPVPINLRPLHLSLNNATSVDLQWDSTYGEGLELVTNGGFEMGSFSGWTLGTNANSHFTLFKDNYEGPIGMVTNQSGRFAVVAHQTGPGTQTLSRLATLPADQFVTIDWADEIQNVATPFTSNHQFRVELRSTNDVVLELLFSTGPDSPSTTAWTPRHFNISQWRGQTVKIAFVIKTTAQGLYVFLDDVHVRGSNPALTTHDVYFGTNASPNAGDLLGSTTNLSWDLPELQPFTTYYWQVVSHRLGDVAGPVWQFRTVATISVTNISVIEGQSGLRTAVFDLRMSTPSPEIVTLDYSTIAGSATAGLDFSEASGTIQFGPGETNKTLQVMVVGDPDYEGNEVFYVGFFNVQNAVLSQLQPSCTILEDDPILFPISDKVVNEGTLLTFVAQAGSPGEAVSEVITDFEAFTVGNGNSKVMFREPLQASSTYLENSPNLAAVTNVFPGSHPGAKVMAVACNFKSTSNGWLRLITAPSGSVPNPDLPNPTVSFVQTLQFDVFTDRPFRLGLGLRETSTTNAIGADGGTSGTVEFVGVTNKVVGPNTPMPTRNISTGFWQRVSFAIPTEPVTGLDGNGILQSTSGKGALAHLAIVPTGGSGVYRFYFDNFAVVYTNQLLFTLSNAPAGATIHPQTGVFSWTPAESQGPGVYEIIVNVTGGAAISATRTFSVTVNEANRVPTLASITNKTNAELSTLSFSAVGSDADLPANVLTYSLDTAPTGASIDPGTGLFTWTPSEAQGPSTNTVVIRVTDNGSPALSQPATFFIYVTEVNSSPDVSVISDKFVAPNGSVSFVIPASDSDIPLNQLTFGLTGTPPVGASIHPGSGLFQWSNINQPGGTTNSITISVQDNGFPVLTTTRTFSVIVMAAPLIQSVEVESGQLTLVWTTVSGRTYLVQQSPDLVAWTDVESIVATGNTATITRPASEVSAFYRIFLVP